MSTSTLDLFSTFVHVASRGAAAPVPVTPDFWRRLQGEERLLLSGALDVILDLPGGQRWQGRSRRSMPPASDFADLPAIAARWARLLAGRSRPPVLRRRAGAR